MDWKTILVTALVLALLLPGVAAAQEENNSTTATPENGGEDDSGPLKSLVEMFTDFVDNFPHTIEEVLTSVFFEPFRTLATQLINMVVTVITHTPSVQGNPAVEEVHQHSLIVAYLLASMIFVVAGLLYITGPIFNVSFQQVRLIIPRLVAALVFGTISLYVLELSVEFTNALTHAFKPAQLALEFEQAMGLSLALIIVVVLKAVLLLAVVLMYIMRDTLILILAAGSPIIAICWAFPKTKRYADSFISMYWTALAIAPLNVFTLRFVFAMMDFSVNSPLQSISNWVFGLAALTLLLLVPYHLYGISTTVVGPASAMAGRTVHKAQRWLDKDDDDGPTELKFGYLHDQNNPVYPDMQHPYYRDPKKNRQRYGRNMLLADSDYYRNPQNAHMFENPGNEGGDE